MRNRTLAASCLAVVGLFAVASAQATTYTFTGGGADANYSNPDNWTGGEVPPNGNNSDVELSSSGSVVNVDTAGYQPNKLTVLPGSTYRLQGQALTTGVNQDVQAGATLYVNNTLNSAYGFLSSEGTLGGIGTLNMGSGLGLSNGVTVSQGSTFAPGDPLINNGIGTLTINGANGLNMGAGWGNPSFAKFTIGATGNSQAVVNGGALHLTAGANDGSTFIFTDAGGATIGKYTLITYDGAPIDPALLATQNSPSHPMQLPDGWVATLGSDSVGNGRSELFVDVTAVPEPASMGLVLAIGAGALVRRRRATV